MVGAEVKFHPRSGKTSRRPFDLEVLLKVLCFTGSERCFFVDLREVGAEVWFQFGFRVGNPWCAECQWVDGRRRSVVVFYSVAGRCPSLFSAPGGFPARSSLVEGEIRFHSRSGKTSRRPFYLETLLKVLCFAGSERCFFCRPPGGWGCACFDCQFESQVIQNGCQA